MVGRETQLEMDFRKLTDRLWPTLAPHQPGYLSGLKERRKAEIAQLREACCGNALQEKAWLDAVQKEFRDEEERRKAAVGALQALLGLWTLLVALLTGLSFWVSQSFSNNPTISSAIVLGLVGLYVAAQICGALLAVMSGLRVRSQIPMPHSEIVLLTSPDAAERIGLATLDNAVETDDRISYKKLAHAFIQNALLGVLILALLLAGALLHNVSLK